jgi:hypothetical protein
MVATRIVDRQERRPGSGALVVAGAGYGAWQFFLAIEERKKWKWSAR